MIPQAIMTHQRNGYYSVTGFGGARPVHQPVKHVLLVLLSILYYCQKASPTSVACSQQKRDLLLGNVMA